ncbi:MAG: FG-GAP-like repeat-containing protein [Candidatus Eiseniibacteriota bacterium]
MTLRRRLPRRGRFLPTLMWIALAAAAPARAQFRDVTSLVPLGSETTAGVAWVDFDGDGDLDVFATTYGNVPGNEFNRLYENVGLRFEDHPVAALGLGPYLCTGSAWADFDDDGDADVFVTSESSAGTGLFRNDGNDAFVDITPPVLRADSSSYTPVWVDYDLDGDLDLSVASRFGGRLFRNDGGGGFANRTPAALDVLTWSVEWSDWDRDGDPDAFLGTIDQPLVLARNDGGGAFRDVALGSLGGGTDGAFSGGFADYDRDGDDDLYVTYFFEPARLFRNEGSFGFADVTPALLQGTGAAYTSSWCDFDLDGDADILRLGHVPGGTALYRNDAASFRDVSPLLGSVTQSNVWSGAWGEWDGDGRPDLFLGLHGSTSDRLLRNENGASRHWLRVDLQGALSQRQGIGARVDVIAGGRMTSLQVSGGGDGWCSQEPASAWFGLGADVSAQVQVSWPSGQVHVISGVSVDRVLTVAEPGLASALQLVPVRSAFDLNLRLDGARVTSATLFARSGGSGGYASFPLFAIGGVALRARLPADLVTEAGMEYWVEYRLNGGTPRTTPYEGVSRPAFLPAEFTNLASPVALPARRFALFGFPFVPSDSTAAALFADDLGALDDRRWRLGRWDSRGRRYVEASDSTLTLSPGQAFWLITDREVRPAASGRGRDIRAGVPITLEPGWNQVAHPFFFPVLVSDVDFSGAPNVERRIVRYGNAGYEDAAVLEPWEGYWMHNENVATETIVVAPRAAPAGRVSASPPVPAKWSVALSARQGGAMDGGNEAGVAAEAVEGRDRGDSLEPPAAPGHVRLWLEAPGEGGATRELTRDLRSASGGGHVWEVAVSSESGERVELTWSGLAGLPAGFEAVLFPRETGARVALSERDGVALPSGRTHRFRLAVGSREFVAAVETGAIDPPRGVELRAPWPSPFAASTTIGYGVPAPGRVTLTVHDVRGRLVRTLVSGTVPGGRHSARWSGDDEGGRAASSGVYFVRLSAGERTVTRKVLLAR